MHRFAKPMHALFPIVLHNFVCIVSWQPHPCCLLEATSGTLSILLPLPFPITMNASNPVCMSGCDVACIQVCCVSRPCFSLDPVCFFFVLAFLEHAFDSVYHVCACVWSRFTFLVNLLSRARYFKGCARVYAPP